MESVEGPSVPPASGDTMESGSSTREETIAVEVVGVEFAGDAATKQRIEQLVREQLLRMFERHVFPLTLRVFVVDRERYPQFVRDRSSGDRPRSPTQNEQYAGVALAIQPSQPSDEHVIILTSTVVHAAMGNEDHALMAAWLGKYTIAHEVAHAVDHLVRPQKSNFYLTEDGSFDIRTVATYYKDLIAREIAACFLSGSTVDDNGLAWLLSEDAEPLGEALRKVRLERRRYRIRIDNDLVGLAFSASQATWVVIAQYAKAFAHLSSKGRPSGEVSFPGFLRNRPLAMDQLQRLARFVGGKTSEYPKWSDPATWDELDDIWRSLAAAIGFWFVQKDQSSALWLTPPES